MTFLFFSLIMVPSWLPLLLAPDDLLYLCVVTIPVTAWSARRVLQWLQDPCNKELILCTKSVLLNGFIHVAIARKLCRQEILSCFSNNFWTLLEMH